MKATSQVERGKYLVRLERPAIYAQVLKQTLCDSRSFCKHCMLLKSATATINCTMLNDLQKEKVEVAGDWRRLSLGQLRQALVAVHVARLLQSNGFVKFFVISVLKMMFYLFIFKPFPINSYGHLNTLIIRIPFAGGDNLAAKYGLIEDR